MKPCPKCGVAHPTEPGVVDWCEACGWNVQPVVERMPRGKVESLYARAGRRAGRRMWEALAAHPGRPRRRIVTAAAYGYSILVHAALVGLLAAGSWLVVGHWRNPIADLIGTALVGAAVVARPRVVSEPETILDPADAPELHRLAHRVVDALGARHLDGISLCTEFNASFARAGWRGRRYVTIGLPLWAILDPQERVALLAHEIGHDVNGDPARGAVVRSALASLIELHALFAPQTYVLRPSLLSPTMGVAAMAANGIMRGISLVFRPPVALFKLIVWRESQRAEFEADRLMARVGGPEAAIRLLEKLHLGDALRSTVAGAAVRDPGCNLLDVMRDRVTGMPERERARHRAAMQLENAKFDATHPPTHHRVELLRGMPSTGALVVVSGAEHAAIQAELAQFDRVVSAQLADEARDRLARRSGRA